MFFSAAVSMEDWTCMFGTWGKPGVWNILTTMQTAGVKRVYWRTLGAGQAPYPSRVTEPLRLHAVAREHSHWRLMDPATTKALGVQTGQLVADFAAFDHQRCAKEIAAELGLEFYLWHESNMESHTGQYSQFILDHPELRALNRWGEALKGTLSWGFPEAIQRRMDLLEEALSYEPDGIVFDLVKGGDHNVPRIDCHGYSCVGYEQPIMEAFREKTGRDPMAIPNNDDEWIRFRAQYVTEFMRKANALIRKRCGDIPVGIFAAHKGRALPVYPNDETFEPDASHVADLRMRALCDFMCDKRSINVGFAGALEGNLEDIDTWISEGVLDYVVSGIIQAPRYVEDKLDSETYREWIEHEKALVAGRVPFGTQLVAWSRTHEHFIEGSRIAKECGCEEVVLFESQGITHNKKWESVAESVAKYGD